MILSLLLLASGLPVAGLTASATGSTPTSLGLAEHGLMAYNDGWVYVYGAKGQQYGGTRASDCAGLLYAYFSDLGVGGCAGGATSQVTQNCIFSDSIYDAYGIPRIHGLALTVFDEYEPETGAYGHIGIYIGNEEEVDNSDYGTNMVRGSVYSRSWSSWHLFDNGVMYPKNGWYEFDNKMVHYTGYEYDIDTVVDGYYIGSDGFAQNPDGTPAAVVDGMISDYYVPASEVRDWLYSAGWDGDDTPGDEPFEPSDPDNPSVPGDPDPSQPVYAGSINASSVNLRSEPHTDSEVVAVLHQGDRLILEEPTEGTEVSGSDKTSNLWYPVTTEYGESGYVSSLFVNVTITAPSITSDGQCVILQAGGADVYYSIDGTDPDTNSIPYSIPIYMLGFTYKAVAAYGSLTSPVITATVLSNGDIFTDFTYDDWYASTVDKAVSLGIFKGTGNCTFSANTLMTRAQFLQVMANMSGEDISGYVYEGKPLYSDVSPRDYFYNAVVWATSKGILNAASGTCNPNVQITREEMCVMLGRFIESSGRQLEPHSNSLFTDDSAISGWAKDYVYSLRDMGVVNGSGNNMFNPKDTATRAAACSLVMSYYDRYLNNAIAPAA